MKKAWRRRNYFIKKELQGRYIFTFFLFVIAGSIVFTMILSVLASDTLTIDYKDYNLRIGKTPLILLREILGAHWIFIIAAALIVVVLSMFFTHRFAGPLFRFEKSAEEMANGNFDFGIHLRKKDEGKELAETMNRLIEMISSSVKEMRGLTDKIDERLAAADRLDDQTKGSAGTDGITEARALNQRLREILYRFKIKN